jgi:hypothetical protein
MAGKEVCVKCVEEIADHAPSASRGCHLRLICTEDLREALCHTAMTPSSDSAELMGD